MKDFVVTLMIVGCPFFFAGLRIGMDIERHRRRSNLRRMR